MIDPEVLAEGKAKWLELALMFNRTAKNILTVYSGAVEAGDVELATTALAALANVTDEVGSVFGVFVLATGEGKQLTDVTDRFVEAMERLGEEVIYRD